MRYAVVETCTDTQSHAAMFPSIHPMQTLDYSTQVFSLGVLLSSLLVYNQMGGIDESSIDKLSSVCEFAKLVRSKSTPEGARCCF